uniref:Sphingomyelin synthase-like domain-containing protein n=1 Tax=Alexandrium catenella TaxID=2925 RepID=A0A7S1M2W0_ALECA
MFGFYVQSVCLHYATYSYVHKYALDSKHPPDKNEYATLADPIEDFLGKSTINIHILDSVAAVFPCAFFSLSVGLAWWDRMSRSLKSRKSLYLRDMRANVLPLWTKVMLCAGFLFILKGIIGAVTTVPDSSGWEVCKARLTPVGVVWMKEDHSFLSMLVLDFWWNVVYHHPLRYCSDMMYSGHTFTVTLFALGLYELVRIVRPTRNKKKAVADVQKVWLMLLLSVFTVGEQGVEIYFVEKTHFHYTSDIVVALLITFLLYTNGAIALASKKWSKEGSKCFRDVWDAVKGRAPESTDAWDKAWDDAEEKDAEAIQDAKAQVAPVIQQNIETWRHLESSGDVFIPPCCVPFCCYAGREHMYSDDQVKEIIRHFVLTEADKDAWTKDKVLMKPLQEYLKASMNISEGITMRTLKTALKGCPREQV